MKKNNFSKMQVTGFSKLSKTEKINWLLKNYLSDNQEAERVIKQYWNSDKALQELHDGFTENAITNFYLPYGIAPNFLIDNKLYAIPMVIEESSVVAAASKAAKFWADKDGFKTEILGNTKIGHIHFTYTGSTAELIGFFRKIRNEMLQKLNPLQQNMKKRGGGIQDINLIDKTTKIPDYYQIEFKFDTVDAMGANFINTVLEEAAAFLQQKAGEMLTGNLQIVMSILSNYTPDNLVRASVSCPVSELAIDGLTGEQYIQKFLMAVKIAEKEIYRAVTHNKGIMNGIDAVVIATGNDFRAVEASAHAYASHQGVYSGLTHAKLENGIFTFWIDIPLALGTVGGLTVLHPLAKFSLQLLQNPTAKQLMKIVASAGLAQNFAAINSLITSGIQKGHMKMHLNNLLNFLNANEQERQKAISYFSDKKVNFNELKKILNR